MWWFSDWADLALLYLDLLISTGIGLIIVISLDEDKSKQIILQIFLGGTKHTNMALIFVCLHQTEDTQGLMISEVLYSTIYLVMYLFSPEFDISKLDQP